MKRLLSFTASLALVIFPLSFMTHAYAYTEDRNLQDKIPKELLEEDTNFLPLRLKTIISETDRMKTIQTAYASPILTTVLIRHGLPMYSITMFPRLK